WWPLAFVAVVPLAWVVVRGSRRQALLGGFVGGLLAGGAAVHWLALFGVVPWLATGVGFGLSGLVFAAVGRLLACRGRLSPLLWLPVVWVGAAWLRGHLFFWAFPWFYLGQAIWPLDAVLQIAELGGQSLVSLLVALVNGWLLAVLIAPSPAARRRTLRLGVLPAALLLAAFAYGRWRLAHIELTDGPLVLVAQPNIPQHLKDASVYDPEKRLRDLTRLTIDAGARTRATIDLVLWPETMLPVYRSTDPALPYAALDRVPQLRSWLASILRRIRARALITGSRHVELRDGEVYEHNSAFCLDPQGELLCRYDKMRLAPVSEYTPFRELWPAFYRFVREHFTPGFTQFEAGSGPVLCRIGRWRIAPNVCFDIMFPDVVRRAVAAGADAVVNVSNYAWFEASAELDLAIVHGKLRAIETRRAVAASVNGGVSHFVDADGRVIELRGVGGRRKQVEATGLHRLRTSTERTPFVRWGDVGGRGSVALAAVLALWSLVRGGRRPRA
ncbi:MAG: apolipoprotein N-acyltransferase, partial [Planctomycetota bacterium]